MEIQCKKITTGSSPSIWNAPSFHLIDVAEFVLRAKQLIHLIKENELLVHLSELSARKTIKIVKSMKVYMIKLLSRYSKL